MSNKNKPTAKNSAQKHSLNPVNEGQQPNAKEAPPGTRREYGQFTGGGKPGNLRK